jgi:hypothetical protein
MEVVKDEGELLEVKEDGKTYSFKVANLGWYEPEKIAEKFIAIEKDEQRPTISRIIMQFAEIDLEILRKGIQEFKLDGIDQVRTPDMLKSIPPEVKDLLVKKAAPNFNKEKARLKNLVQS